MAKVHFETDETRKTELQSKLRGEILPRNLKLFEDKLAQTNTGFLIGNGVTYTDLFLFSLLDWIHDQKETLFAHFPHMKSHNQKIAEIPNVAKHIATRPVTLM